MSHLENMKPSNFQRGRRKHHSHQTNDQQTYSEKDLNDECKDYDSAEPNPAFNKITFNSYETCFGYSLCTDATEEIALAFVRTDMERNYH